MNNPRRTALAAAAAFCLAAAVFAQTAAPDAAVTEQQETTMTLWEMWNVGGPFMWPIGLLSIACTALAVFGFINYREGKMVHAELMTPLQESIRQLDFRRAHTLCTGTPSVMTNILSAGLARLGSDTHLDVTSVEKAMEEAAVEENTAGLRPINYISICASIAPMFGLLGTVSGMIKAFQKIGMGAMGDPEKLAANIGEAMITTAFGLLVGIPAMFFYFYLKSKFTGNMSRIGRLLGNLTHEMAVVFRKVDAGELAPPPPAETEPEGEAPAAPAGETAQPVA